MLKRRSLSSDCSDSWDTAAVPAPPKRASMVASSPVASGPPLSPVSELSSALLNLMSEGGKLRKRNVGHIITPSFVQKRLHASPTLEDRRPGQKRGVDWGQVADGAGGWGGFVFDSR